MAIGFPVLKGATDVLCEIRDAIKQMAGAQKVSTNNATKSGTAANAYGTDITLPFIASKLDVILYDNGAVFKRTQQVASQYDDEIELIGPGHYTFLVTTAQVNIKNAVSGSNARYSFVAWN